jgi:hypothetical protein
MPNICWRCGSIAQTDSGTAIGSEFQKISMINLPHQFESHPSRKPFIRNPMLSAKMRRIV